MPPISQKTHRRLCAHYDMCAIRLLSKLISGCRLSPDINSTPLLSMTYTTSRLTSSDMFEREKWSDPFSDVAAGDPHLAQGDLRFEPVTALASGADGLNDLRRIIADAPHWLQPGGWLLLEPGYDQGRGGARFIETGGLGSGIYPLRSGGQRACEYGGKALAIQALAGD